MALTLREQLAEIEHDQWMSWAETLIREGLTPERIERWRRFLVPYSELDEATKDYDRVWADRVLLAMQRRALR